MKFDLTAFALTLAVFFAVLLLGMFLMNRLPYGYTEAALLYLSAVVGAGAFWIGRKR